MWREPNNQQNGEIEAMTMKNSGSCGKPDVGKPHDRFDDGDVASHELSGLELAILNN